MIVRATRQPKSPDGVATLELVLCAPIVLALTVAIVWLGVSVIGQSEVVVEARNKAWQKRFDGAGGTALNFLRDDLVTEDATTEIRVSPVLDDAAPPASSHEVMSGSWDHNELPLDRPPNWEQHARAAINAQTGQAQIAYTDARNLLGELQGQAESLLAQALQESLARLADPTDLFRAARESTDDRADSEEATLNQDILRKQRLIDNEIREEIERLRRRRAAADDDEQRDLLDALIKVQENKRARIELDIEDLEADLKALAG